VLPRRSISIDVGANVTVTSGSLVLIEDVAAEETATEFVAWFDRV
jgi:hypothetical protein